MHVPYSLKTLEVNIVESKSSPKSVPERRRFWVFLACNFIYTHMQTSVSLAIGSKTFSLRPSPPKRLRTTMLACGSLGGGGGRVLSSHTALPWRTAYSSAHNRHSVSELSRIQMTEIED